MEEPRQLKRIKTDPEQQSLSGKTMPMDEPMSEIVEKNKTFIDMLAIIGNENAKIQLDLGWTTPSDLDGALHNVSRIITELYETHWKQKLESWLESAINLINTFEKTGDTKRCS